MSENGGFFAAPALTTSCYISLSKCDLALMEDDSTDIFLESFQEWDLFSENYRAKIIIV